MDSYVTLGTYKVAECYHQFMNKEVLPQIGIDSTTFWDRLSQVLDEHLPANHELLEKRQILQAHIDDWHLKNPFPFNFPLYKKMLEDIGYLVPEGPDFTVSTTNVDPEISDIAGPQLVVPITNPRYALNAANARWGSLYDALYGTDIIPESNGLDKGATYNQRRGAEVIERAKKILDDSVPLSDGSYKDIVAFTISEGSFLARTATGENIGLATPEQFIGWTGNKETPDSILLRRNGLHIELVFEAGTVVATQDPTGLSDIILESAVTTIIDLEDSVATVDAEDKVSAYRNWLGLMDQTLSASFEKGGETLERRLNSDKKIVSVDGSSQTLKGRSLLLIRNVGHLMTSDLIKTESNDEVPEGILDAVTTVAIGMVDLLKHRANSNAGSIYIVKPKMHGPEEVAFANRLFESVEDMLGLDRNTVKMGIMDEERRTTVNLKECIRAAQTRVAFINTGFLDRTGDEIHTSMNAGPMVRKGDMRQAQWISAYEDWNVDIGIACGLPGKAQIGKGMWAMPDLMAAMLEQKKGHPEAGANTAWVPSPTAATIHALHYHSVDVPQRQRELSGRTKANIDHILTLPVESDPGWSEDEITAELENNAQGILGYVVRWIDQGVGCSKVPDINDIGLMEDRATLRISSQHIANWLHHGICTKEQVENVFEHMAGVVDRQNEGDPAYIPMAGDTSNNIAYQAAKALVFDGLAQPSGYTEPILHRERRQAK
tara:strand:+ start:14452 stop:16605 length:2154 start_codon:yes stop_codon:yes gene_type:complete